MNITLTIRHGHDAETTVDCGPATLIACERHFGESMATLLTPVRVEVMAWLAWEQTRRNGVAVAPFDKWADELHDIANGGEPGPLPATA